MPLSTISWLDPCIGSGVFPQAILEQTLTTRRVAAERDLPVIGGYELSPQGILCSALVIDELLREFQLRVEEYAQTGRLMLVQRDSLSLLAEQPDLAEPPRAAVDVVVGNPPYVRSNRLTSEYKRRLRAWFPSSFSGAADLYGYFVTGGLAIVRTGGVACFISPASFFRSHTSAPLRARLNELGYPEVIIDLDETPVFENVNLHTAIYTLRRTIPPASEPAKYAHVSTAVGVTALRSSMPRTRPIPRSDITPAGWRFTQRDCAAVDLDTAPATIPLAQIYKVLSGVRPGNVAAFVYDAADLTGLDDEVRAAWFKECLTARNLQRWTTPRQNRRLLMATPDRGVPPRAIEQLLDVHRARLEIRPEVVAGTPWFALRPCAYYGAFEQPHIVYPDIASEPRFAFEGGGRITLDGAYIVATSDLALLGILNSSHAWSFFKRHCSSVGSTSGRGRVRLKKNHLQSLPIPALFGESRRPPAAERLEIAVARILDGTADDDAQNEVDRLVAELYRGPASA